MTTEPTAATTTPPAASGGINASLVFLGMSTALAIIDATIVNVALPSITRHLGLSLSAGEWVVSGYGVMLASLLITLGSLADSRGQRRVLIAGIALFALASLGCALAPNGGVLVLARLVQGVGAAAILPTVLSIINSTFRGPSLNVAFAVFGATIGTSAALGPLLGSFLVDTFGWQSAFLINLPLAVIVIIGLLVTVPKLPGRPAPGLDLGGQIFLVLALASLVFGLVEAPRGGWLTPISAISVFGATWPVTAPVSVAFAAFAVAAVSLIALVVIERGRDRRGQVTLIDLELFAIPSFRAGVIAITVVALGEFGILFLLPLYLQVGRGLSPLHAQLVVLPTAFGTFISAPITARRKQTPARTWVLLGLGLEVTGLLLLSLAIHPTASNAWLSLPLLVYGTGVGFAISQLTGATLLGVPFTHLGQASGLSSTGRQVGSAVGVAVLTAVLSGSLALTLPGHLKTYAPDLNAAQRTAATQAIRESPADPASAGAIYQSLPPQSLPGVAEATLHSLATGTSVAALAAAVPLALAWFLARRLPTRRLAHGDGPSAPQPAAPAV